MILKKLVKQPSEVKDYDVDYSEWLSEMDNDMLNEVYAKVTCITNPNDTTLECDDIVHTTEVAKLWMRGGTDGYRYKVEITAITVEGRIDESELIFRIKDY